MDSSRDPVFVLRFQKQLKGVQDKGRRGKSRWGEDRSSSGGRG